MFKCHDHIQQLRILGLVKPESHVYMMLDQCMLQRGSTVLNNLSNKMLNIHCLCVGGRKEICHTCNVQRGLCQNNSKECFLVFRLHPLTL